MRRKRSERNKQQKRTSFNRVVGLLVLTTFGVGQVTATTHALYTSGGQNASNTLTAAFVFPKTVQGLADRVRQDSNQAEGDSQSASTFLAACKKAETSKEASTYSAQASSAAADARKAADDANAVANVLSGYATHAQNDLNAAKRTLSSLLQQKQALTDLITSVSLALQTQSQSFFGFLDQQKKAQLQAQLTDLQRQLDALGPKIMLAQNNVQSCQRVYDYVQTGYASGNAYATSANASASSAAACAASAIDCVKEKIEAEKKAAEEKAKKEAEEKAKKEAEEKAAAEKAASDKADVAKAATDKAARGQSSTDQPSQAATDKGATGQ